MNGCCRDASGTEVGLAPEYADDVFPIEIKVASTFTPRFIAGLDVLSSLAPCRRGVILGGGQAGGLRSGTRILPWTQFAAPAEEFDSKVRLRGPF